MSEERPRESLVQFENAIEGGAGIDGLDPKSGKRSQLPPLESRPSTEDLLNAILPPRQWVENGKHYIQYVSH